MTDKERLGPPPIEPLSDAAWSRVERGLWSQIDAPATTRPAAPAPSRRWLVAVPVLAAAATFAIVFAVRQGAPVLEPSRIVSGSAPAAVSLGDVHIELDAATAVVTSHDTGHPVAVIERGAAWFTVAPRGKRPDFVVRAGDATVRVVGTRFRVARAGDRSSVEVEHGAVEVVFRGAVISVGAGQRWSSEEVRQIATAIPPPPPPPPAAAPPAATPPAPAEPAAPPAPAEPAAPPARPAHTAARPRATPSPAAEPATPLVPPAAPTAAADDDRAEFDRLAGLEPGAPGAALAGYLALARGTGPWAAPALFAAARLAVDTGDRRGRALLEAYLQRFPRGGNAADARQLLERLP